MVDLQLVVSLYLTMWSTAYGFTLSKCSCDCNFSFIVILSIPFTLIFHCNTPTGSRLHFSSANSPSHLADLLIVYIVSTICRGIRNRLRTYTCLFLNKIVSLTMCGHITYYYTIQILIFLSNCK